MTLFYISALLLAINHKECSQRKWNCWQNHHNNPRYWSVSAAAPWLLAKTLLCAAHTHTVRACVCVCVLRYLPIGTLSTLMGGSWLWGSEMWSSSWSLLCRGQQHRRVLGTCTNGLGSPYCYCAQQAYPPYTYPNPSLPPLHLLNLPVRFSLRQITCWVSGQGVHMA